MNNSAFEFEYGENIVVSKAAPQGMHPGEDGWVCSMRIVETETQAKSASYPIATVLYLVEFRDGSDIELPEEYIRHVEE